MTKKTKRTKPAKAELYSNAIRSPTVETTIRFVRAGVTVSQALRELNEWREKFAGLKELAPIFGALHPAMKAVRQAMRRSQRPDASLGSDQIRE